ncbi:hypothetical protein [Streptomyces hydrogenans]|uniref:hypothetical protein n=1 Tax=Streptomyces hydrogenans TaxID=1873719 RepID=UPI00381CC8B5
MVRSVGLSDDDGVTVADGHVDHAGRRPAAALGRAHLLDHDLEAAWLPHGTALAPHWTGDALPEDVRALARDKLLLQGDRL